MQCTLTCDTLPLDNSKTYSHPALPYITLFHTLNSKFKPQYNEKIKSLQFCKLVRQSTENAKEWMCRLRIATAECNYKEIDRQLKEQFRHGLNDSDMIIETIKEPTKMENENMTSEQVLAWARIVEAQKAQSAILKQLNETEDFDKISTRKSVQTN